MTPVEGVTDEQTAAFKKDVADKESELNAINTNYKNTSDKEIDENDIEGLANLNEKKIKKLDDEITDLSNKLEAYKTKLGSAYDVQLTKINVLKDQLADIKRVFAEKGEDAIKQDAKEFGKLDEEAQDKFEKILKETKAYSDGVDAMNSTPDNIADLIKDFELKGNKNNTNTNYFAKNNIKNTLVDRMLAENEAKRTEITNKFLEKIIPNITKLSFITKEYIGDESAQYKFKIEKNNEYEKQKYEDKNLLDKMLGDYKTDYAGFEKNITILKTTFEKRNIVPNEINTKEIEWKKEIISGLQQKIDNIIDLYVTNEGDITLSKNNANMEDVVDNIEKCRNRIASLAKNEPLIKADKDNILLLPGISTTLIDKKIAEIVPAKSNLEDIIKKEETKLKTLEENEKKELDEKTKKTKLYYQNKKDLLYDVNAELNPNGKNRADNQENNTRDVEGGISEPEENKVKMVNEYCKTLQDGDKIFFQGRASISNYADSEHLTKNKCDALKNEILSKLIGKEEEIFEAALNNAVLVETLPDGEEKRTKISYNEIKEGDGNMYLCRGRALSWANKLSQENLVNNIFKIRFEMKPNGPVNVADSRGGDVVFENVQGERDYAGLDTKFPDQLFQNNLSYLTNNEKTTKEYEKKRDFFANILANDPRTVVLLEGFTGTSDPTFGGEKLNNWFETNMFTQEQLLSYVKSGQRQYFKEVQNTSLYGAINPKYDPKFKDFMDKYIDVEKIKKDLAKNNITINGETRIETIKYKDEKTKEEKTETKTINFTPDEVLEEVIRRITLSINRSEKIKDDMVDKTLEIMNKDDFAGTKQTRKEIEDRIFMVGHGTRNREVSAGKRDYRRGTGSILQKTI